MPPKRSEEHFWSRVNKNGAGGCWLWTGYKDRDGYGRVTINYSPRFVHRIAYEFIRGPIPGNSPLDHLCRVRACCNPDHLDPVSNEENIRRGYIARGTAAFMRPHGTRVRYQNGGCRCDECRIANIAYNKEIRRQQLLRGDFQHGWRGRSIGCKCDVCRLAWNAYCKEKYHARLSTET